MMSGNALTLSRARASVPSWLERLVNALRSRREKVRLDDELDRLDDRQLRDLGVDRSDLCIRFASERRKVDRLVNGGW